MFKINGISKQVVEIEVPDYEIHKIINSGRIENFYLIRGIEQSLHFAVKKRLGINDERIYLNDDNMWIGIDHRTANPATTDEINVVEALKVLEFSAFSDKVKS